VEKRCDEEELEEEELRHILGRFGIAVNQFRFSFVFLGLQQIGPNRYT